MSAPAIHHIFKPSVPTTLGTKERDSTIQMAGKNPHSNTCPGGGLNIFRPAQNFLWLTNPLGRTYPAGLAYTGKAHCPYTREAKSQRLVKKFPKFFGDSPSIAMATMASTSGIGNNGAPTW
jgi:hypothetical protein